MFLEICTLKHEEPGNLNILKHIELLMVPGTWNHQQRKPLDPVLSIAHGELGQFTRARNMMELN